MEPDSILRAETNSCHPVVMIHDSAAQLKYKLLKRAVTNKRAWLSCWGLSCSQRTTRKVLLTRIFVFCWPCISLQILGNNQMYALFHVFIYFMSLRVSSVTALIIRRSNCINTSSGMISLCKWLLGMPVLSGIPSSHLHRLIIPDDVLIQFDLLMMSAVTLETCRDMK